MGGTYARDMSGWSGPPPNPEVVVLASVLVQRRQQLASELTDRICEQVDTYRDMGPLPREDLYKLCHDNLGLGFAQLCEVGPPDLSDAAADGPAPRRTGCAYQGYSQAGGHSRHGLTLFARTMTARDRGATIQGWSAEHPVELRPQALPPSDFVLICRIPPRRSPSIRRLSVITSTVTADRSDSMIVSNPLCRSISQMHRSPLRQLVEMRR